VSEFFKARWARIGAVALALFVVNLAGRLAAKIVDGADNETIAGWVTLGTIFLIFAVLAVVWGRGRPAAAVCFDLGMAAVAGCLLSVLLGPLVFGLDPFANGPGAFFEQIWWYAALAIGGTGLGLMIITTLGVDYKSKQLKLYAQYAEKTSKTLSRRS
jgi:hypothetical protein